MKIEGRKKAALAFGLFLIAVVLVGRWIDGGSDSPVAGTSVPEARAYALRQLETRKQVWVDPMSRLEDLRLRRCGMRAGGEIFFGWPRQLTA